MGNTAASAHVRARSQTSEVVDPLWRDLRTEAERSLRDEPALAGLVWSGVLSRSSLEGAVGYRVAARLGSETLPDAQIAELWADAIAAEPRIASGMRADLRAVLERDPAARGPLDPVLFYKGFHALQAHRLAHRLWNAGRRDLALFFQCRSSEVFQTDIHPAVHIGSGVFLDHATGFVAGETAIIGDDVSILQGVTLGGSGLAHGDRHPKIRNGCLLGAGAQIVGPVEIGTSARVAAGSVVLMDVPPCTTVAGVPARIVGSGGCAEPAKQMDQQLADSAYASFTYTI